MQLWHLHRLVRNYGCITSNQTPSNGNCNITDEYTYIAFENRTCDNMISAITDAVMTINGAIVIMFLAMATMHTAVVLKL